MKFIYLKSALKFDSFDVAIDIKILLFRVLVTMEPDRSLLQFVTTNCLTKADKGNTLVVMDTKDYDSKLNTLLKDEKKRTKNFLLT